MCRLLSTTFVWRFPCSPDSSPLLAPRLPVWPCTQRDTLRLVPQTRNDLYHCRALKEGSHTQLLYSRLFFTTLAGFTNTKSTTLAISSDRYFYQFTSFDFNSFTSHRIAAIAVGSLLVGYVTLKVGFSGNFNLFQEVLIYIIVSSISLYVCILYSLCGIF